MASFFSSLLDWLRSLFFSKGIEVTIIGLQNSGKTSLVNVLVAGQFSESMVPTVGFNMRKIQKGAVTMKLWDIGGQPRFRSMWERYCRAVSAMLFVVDSADPQAIDASRAELHSLLEKTPLSGIPLLVLGNKNDLEGALKVGELIERLELSKLTGREVSIYSISAKNAVNIDVTLAWLAKRA